MDLLTYAFLSQKGIDIQQWDESTIKKKEIQNEVIDCISGLLDIVPDKITLEDDIVEDLGANSFVIAEIFLCMENKYNIKLEEEFILGKSVHVQNIIDLVIKNTN